MFKKFSCLRYIHRGEGGSFLVAGALFMFIFLGIGTFAVDLSRYYKEKQRLQDIADGAVLAGGQALNQFKDNPDEAEAYQAALDYIRSTQGDSYVDLYEVHSPTDVDGITVTRFGGSPDTSCAEFTINSDGSIVAGEPVNVESKVLGSAVTDQYGGRDYPVTSKITISDSQGNDTTVEPWGNYDDPNGANLNNDAEKPGVDLTDYPEETEITADGRLYYPDGGPYSGYSIYGEKSSESPEVMTLKDGDTPPEISGGFDQPSVADYLKDVVDTSTGKIDLQKNQAIMNFELTHDADHSKADFQDLILLITMTPTTGSGVPGGGSGASYSKTTSTSKCSGEYGTNYYRVGAVVYGQFEPYFWPREIFGDKNAAVTNHSVAEVRPRRIFQSHSEPLDCGVYADGIMSLTGNNFDASGADFCANSNINGGGSNNGMMGDVNLLETASFTPPGGGAGEVSKFSSPREMPDFQATSPADYEVNLQDFSSWSDLGECGGGPPGGPPGGSTTKALRTTAGGTANVVWSSSGSAVCIEKSGGDYTIDKKNGGQIQRAGASPVTIYADGDLTFTGNGNGVNGGLYTTGDFTVTRNGYDFNGDKSKLGGLAVWAEGDVDLQKNNISINGITGADGNYTFGSPGGGTGPKLSGVLVSGGVFDLISNSNNAQIKFDKSKFDSNYLDVGAWSFLAQAVQGRPLYSRVKVRLID